MKHSRFGVANWFVRRGLDDETIEVFGDGSLLRDFVYVQDAVEAMIRCAATGDVYGEVFNVGNSRASSFLELAETVVRVAGSGRWKLAPFSPERAAQEPGDFVSDIRKIKQARRGLGAHDPARGRRGRDRAVLPPSPEALLVAGMDVPFLDLARQYRKIAIPS